MVTEKVTLAKCRICGEVDMLYVNNSGEFVCSECLECKHKEIENINGILKCKKCGEIRGGELRYFI